MITLTHYLVLGALLFRYQRDGYLYEPQNVLVC